MFRTSRLIQIHQQLIYQLFLGSTTAFSFQFFTRLAAVFAEEVGCFFLVFRHGPVCRCFAINIYRVHISPSSQVLFDGFDVSVSGSIVNRDVWCFG